MPVGRSASGFVQVGKGVFYQHGRDQKPGSPHAPYLVEQPGVEPSLNVGLPAKSRLVTSENVPRIGSPCGVYED
jgi:hypothetical protein